MMASFTDEELAIAKNVDLCDVARSLGYTVRTVGRWHTVKEMDSLRIYDRRTWFRWSLKTTNGINGGTQIDFLREFAGLSIKDAVFCLLDFAGYRRDEEYVPKVNTDIPKETEQRPFVLPESADGCSYILGYLTGERKLDEGLVRFLITKGLIYEDKYHNVVFKGYDKNGECKFASRRGTFDRGEKPFKRDVAGSNKAYGFNLIADSDEIYVFEGAIDMLSFMDLFEKYDANMVALGMLSDEPLSTMLKEYPNIRKIGICLDNDEPGQEAAKKIIKKYELLGYEVADMSPPEGYKDYNDLLKSVRKEMIVKSR